MAKDEAKRFLDALRAGGELAEAVRDAGRAEGESAMAFYTRAAKEKGFDFDEAELEAAYAEMGSGLKQSLEVVELDDDELEQMGVAGGWCWFDNECSKVINYTKANPNCYYTYGGSDENCVFNDSCNLASNEYWCTNVDHREEHGNGK